MLTLLKKLNLFNISIILLILSGYILIASTERKMSQSNSFNMQNVKFTSYNMTATSYAIGSLKKSRPAPFRLAILSLLVSDFVVDNYEELGNKLYEFDVMKFYEEILKKGGTRGITNYKNCCIESCLGGLNTQKLNNVLMLDNMLETAEFTSICENMCDHTLQHLRVMDYFFSPSSELFELRLLEKKNDTFLETEDILSNASNITNAQRAIEEEEDIMKIQSFSLDNKQNINESLVSKFQVYDNSEDSSLKDANIMNFMDDKDFETEEYDVKSKLLLLWDVDKTLWDVYRVLHKNSFINTTGKYNPYSMSLLFLLKERQQYDPRILDQYIITYGLSTISKLQPLFLRQLCYSCWDIMRIYDRYFADENDSLINQDYKRVFEAKEQTTVSFKGDEYRFRNCPGTLKNILFWRGKDVELIRNHIVSRDENLRNEYMDINSTLTKVEIENNIRIPFKVRKKKKIDNIVTLLIDDTISHVRLACVEEYHEFNIVVIPLIPFSGISMDQKIELEMSENNSDRLTVDVFDSDILKVKGLDSKYLPTMINKILNQVPLNASSDELSKAIRTKISEIVPGIYPESQCNYDITNPKPLYFILLSSCRLFNDIVNLFSKLPESHPSFSDIAYLLSTTSTWGFDESIKSKSCSIVNEKINEFRKMCSKAKNNKFRDSNKSGYKDRNYIKRMCSFNWKNKFFFGFGLRGLFGPLPLNALATSLLPRKKTIILNIEADHLFNNIPLSLYENKFFYCTIKTNLFSSTTETIRKIPIAMRAALKFASKASSTSLNDKISNSLEIVTNSTKIFQNQLSDLFEKYNSVTSSGKGHYKIYEHYTNCMLIE